MSDLNLPSKGFLPILLTAGALCAAFVLWQLRSSNAKTPGESRDAPTADVAFLGSSESMPQDAIQPVADSLPAAKLLAAYACPAPACPGIERAYSAATLEEARWMQANGFPTQAQRQWAVGRSSEEILRRAREEGSSALEALGLEARLRENPSRADVIDTYYEQRDAAFATGKGYFLYGAFKSGLVRERGSVASLDEMEGRTSLPDYHEKHRRRIAGQHSAETLVIATLLGDHQAAALIDAEGGEDAQALRFAMSSPRVIASAWSEIELQRANPHAPIWLRTMQPRPQDPIPRPPQEGR